jgi:hypothetical protein
MKLPTKSIKRVVHVLARAELGDPRRTRRLGRVAEKVARTPGASLPAALGSDAEVQGCYRLMNSPHLSFETLLAVQAEATRQRAKETAGVLVVHDTTDCAFPHADPKELGYLQTGKAGFRLHLALVVDAAHGRPLGVSHAECLFRSQRPRTHWSERGRGRKSRHEDAPEPRVRPVVARAGGERGAPARVRARDPRRGSRR